ncbi:hypothetical protein CJ030_MR7G002279 [Morella rubra]|uniref:Uncharacterized protein n=1 Tax=Morella rubra TaxID=262757 RepID=A0A6A1V1T9_9ROSI|nr:hypothetical protein CJ030_MR7G002279 [Morella rubra]
MTARRSFAHRSGSQSPTVALQPKVPAWAIEEIARSSAETTHSQLPPAALLKDEVHHNVGTFEQVIAPIINSLAAMDERFS